VSDATEGATAGTAQVPFFDTHVHFWDHSVPGFVWAWLDPSFQQFGETHLLDAPRFTAPEFRQECEGAGVAGLVHVNATAPLPDPSAETAWLDQMADVHGWPNAIVGACQLASADAPDLMRRHARWSRMRGVRDLTFSQRPDLDAVGPALAAAADLELCIELRTPVSQLDVIGNLAERWPTVRFLLSHAGLPHSRTEETYIEWRAAISRLADRPNIACKISAVAGNSDRNWTLESIRPWIMGCIDAFGADRCMFGTNWPLDRLWRPYVDVVAAYRQITADLAESSQHDLFHRTAERTFRTSLS
jgi:predicted TIM-barrel fold metal-dependent hydrolase